MSCAPHTTSTHAEEAQPAVEAVPFASAAAESASPPPPPASAPPSVSDADARPGGDPDVAATVKRGRLTSSDSDATSSRAECEKDAEDDGNSRKRVKSEVLSTDFRKITKQIKKSVFNN